MCAELHMTVKANPQTNIKGKDREIYLKSYECKFCSQVHTE